MTVDQQVAALFATSTGCQPGAAVGIYADGTILYAGGYGFADLDTSTPNTPTTVFDTCAIAKPFVALTIASLISEGMLNADHSIRSVVPELPGFMQAITVRHLLANTSGIRDFISLAYLQGRAPSELSSDDTLSLLANQRDLNFPPGQGFLYSHSDYFLVKLCAERVTSCPFDMLAYDRIFAPLRMARTTFMRPCQTAAQGYHQRAARFARRVPEYRRTPHCPLFSTVEDLAKWDFGLRSSSIGAASDSYLAAISKPYTLPAGRQRYAWGLVLASGNGCSTWGNGGSWDGYSSAWLHLSDDRVSAVVLSNLASCDAFALAEQLIDIGLAEVTGSARGTRSWNRLVSGPNIDAADPMPDITPDVQCSGVFYSTELNVIYELDGEAAVRVYREDDCVALLNRRSLRLAHVGRPGTVTISAANALHLPLVRVQ